MRIERVLTATATIFVLSVTPAQAQTSGAAAIWGIQGKDCVAPGGVAQPWRDKSQTPECRARFVLDQLKTLDDKLRFLLPPPIRVEGARDMAAEFGLPRIAGSDGPAGLVRGGTGATALPSVSIRRWRRAMARLWRMNSALPGWARSSARRSTSREAGSLAGYRRAWVKTHS
jgi:hypothetical protein